jgi:hypothetical protein
MLYISRYVSVISLASLPAVIFVLIDRSVSIFAQCRHYRIISEFIKEHKAELTENSQTATIILGFVVLLASAALIAMIMRITYGFRHFDMIREEGDKSARQGRSEDIIIKIILTLPLVLIQFISTAISILQKIPLLLEINRNIRNTTVPATCAVDDFEYNILQTYYSEIPAKFNTIIRPAQNENILLNNMPFVVTSFRDVLFLVVIMICILISLVTLRYLFSLKFDKNIPDNFQSTVKMIYTLVSSASIISGISILLTSSIFKVGESLYDGEALKFMYSSRFNALLLLNIEFTCIILTATFANLWTVLNWSIKDDKGSGESNFKFLKSTLAKSYTLVLFVPTIVFLILETVSRFFH